MWWYERVGLWEVIQSCGISALTVRASRKLASSLSALHHVRTQESGCPETRRRALTKHPTHHAGTLISDFLPPDPWGISVCCLSHSVCGVLLEQPSRTTQGQSSEGEPTNQPETCSSFTFSSYKQQGADASYSHSFQSRAWWTWEISTPSVSLSGAGVSSEAPRPTCLNMDIMSGNTDGRGSLPCPVSHSNVSLCGDEQYWHILKYLNAPGLGI